MEHRRIGKAPQIKKESLNKNQYFISVLKKGNESGLLDSQLMFNIQAEIAAVFSELIMRYTAGESSSVKDETASTILASVYYAIDAFAATLSNPGDLFALLREKGAGEIYKAGFKIVSSCFEQAKKLYDEILRDKLIIPLAAYNDTVDNALPEFFATYNIEFDAQNTACSMDYPVLFDDMTVRGVFYIRQYLEKLKLETQFCNCFDQKSILKLLFDYEAKFHTDIINAPANLFEIIFDQLLFSVLSGSGEMELTVSALQYEFTERSLAVKNHQELSLLLDKAVQEIIESFKLSGPGLIDYIRRYRHQYAFRFLSAFDSRNLLNMVIVKEDDPQAGKVVFEDGARMDDMDFANLIDLILECESTAQKIEKITASVHSVKDYIDLLEADCLYEDEFSAVLEALSDISLAVLGNIVFDDQLRSGQLHLSPASRDTYKKNLQWEWQNYYIDFILGMNDKRRNDVEKLINAIIYSEPDDV